MAQTIIAGGEFAGERARARSGIRLLWSHLDDIRHRDPLHDALRRLQ